MEDIDSPLFNELKCFDYRLCTFICDERNIRSFFNRQIAVNIMFRHNLFGKMEVILS